MGKNKKARKIVKKEINLDDNMLPQNIVLFGEHVEENKNIYIAQNIYKEIHKFTKDKTTNESGGILVGNIIKEFDKTNIVIRGFIEAKYCEGTPTTLTFTHQTWEYVHKEVEKKFPQYKIVGWIHTHPNFGIFLSEYDKFIQENFFKEENQIAYVVDPIQKIEGFYFWVNDKIEKCKGFYVFDKNNTKITVSQTEKNHEEVEEKEEKSVWKNVLLGILSFIIIILIITTINMNTKINKLINDINIVLNNMNQQIYNLNNDLNKLKTLEMQETQETM